MALPDLAATQRFSNDNFLKISLYSPIGLVLAFIRFNIGILVWLCAALLSEYAIARSAIVNMTCFVLGITVKKSGERHDDTQIVIANSVSVFDSLVLNVTTSCIGPSKLDLPPPLAWILGVRHIGVPTTYVQYRDIMKKKFADIPDAPIFIQPEGCPTSGKGLLKFGEWPFSLDTRVQPVAIRVTRLFGNVTTGALSHFAHDSIAWADLFWFLWNPYTSFTVHILPVVEKIERETNEEFADRTQKIIADFLKIEATQYTGTELRELILGREVERRPNTANVRRMPTTSSVRPELQRMAAQIKEILPSVPLSVITKDLGKTRNIDITLSNILEGSVTYTPEDTTTEPAKETNVAGPSSEVRPPPPPLRTAAETFPRTAHDRQLSYQERKVQLIEAARRRYIDKHGLQNC